MTSSDQPIENIKTLEGYIRAAAAGGATLIVTPEVSNCISNSRHHQNEVLCLEHNDPCLEQMRLVASDLQITLILGSLAVKTSDADGRFANRSYVITPTGKVSATYDKIHMFDADVQHDKSYRESHGYRAGTKSVVAKTDAAQIGLTICYDVRFPSLYRHLAQSGAEILTIPAAFTVPTGRAHWEVLLRARAIETGCFVIAPAQTGIHTGSGRETWGHSMIISPWGEVLVNAGTAPGIIYADLDISEVQKARQAIPSLANGRHFAHLGKHE